MTVAEAVAATFRAQGVRWVFGHPGGEVTPLLDALRRTGVPFQLTHHEATAALMAGAVGEMTGRPGVAVATLGPGACNLTAGVAHALLDRAPMVAISAEMPVARAHFMPHQNLELPRLFAPITKWSSSLGDGDPARTVRRAMATAATPRQGPVYLALPSDVARDEVQQAPSTGGWPEGLETAWRAEVERVAERIGQWVRPALVIGLDAARAGVSRQLTALHERWQTPFLTTPKAKGLIPETTPGRVGVLDMQGHQVLGRFLEQCDGILAVGVDPVEMNAIWPEGPDSVQVNQVPALDGYMPAGSEAVGHLPALLHALAAALPLRRLDQDEGRLSQVAAAMEEAVRGRPRRSGVPPVDLVRAIRARTSADTIAVTDVGAHKMLVGQAWLSEGPCRFFMSNGLSSMGYGMPTAMAAGLVFPSAPVVLFVGDGGLHMYLGELATLRRLGVGVQVVVMDDQSLTLIEMSQENQGLPPQGVHFEHPDYAALARAFGLAYVPVEHIEDINGMPKHGSALIHVHVDAGGYRT